MLFAPINITATAAASKLKPSSAAAVTTTVAPTAQKYQKKSQRLFLEQTKAEKTLKSAEFVEAMKKLDAKLVAYLAEETVVIRMKQQQQQHQQVVEAKQHEQQQQQLRQNHEKELIIGGEMSSLTSLSVCDDEMSLNGTASVNHTTSVITTSTTNGMSMKIENEVASASSSVHDNNHDDFDLVSHLESHRENNASPSALLFGTNDLTDIDFESVVVDLGSIVGINGIGGNHLSTILDEMLSGTKKLDVFRNINAIKLNLEALTLQPEGTKRMELQQNEIRPIFTVECRLSNELVRNIPRYDMFNIIQFESEKFQNLTQCARFGQLEKRDVSLVSRQNLPRIQMYGDVWKTVPEIGKEEDDLNIVTNNNYSKDSVNLNANDSGSGQFSDMENPNLGRIHFTVWWREPSTCLNEMLGTGILELNELYKASLLEQCKCIAISRRRIHLGNLYLKICLQIDKQSLNATASTNDNDFVGLIPRAGTTSAATLAPVTVGNSVSIVADNAGQVLGKSTNMAIQPIIASHDQESLQNFENNKKEILEDITATKNNDNEPPSTLPSTSAGAEESSATTSFTSINQKPLFIVQNLVNIDKAARAETATTSKLMTSPLNDAGEYSLELFMPQSCFSPDHHENHQQKQQNHPQNDGEIPLQTQIQ